MNIKKILVIMSLFILNLSYAKILGKVDLPENWEIKDTKVTENYKVGDLVVQKFITQVISKGDEDVVVYYYVFSSTDDLMNLFFNRLDYKESLYIGLKDKTGYMIEGSPVARKNILRFLRLPILEQIKVVYKDLNNVEVEIIKERELSEEETNKFAKEYGIDIVKAKEQVFKVRDGIGLSVIFFLCKDGSSAQLGYKNARIKNTSELVSFLFSQNFLIRLGWIKV